MNQSDLTYPGDAPIRCLPGTKVFFGRSDLEPAMMYFSYWILELFGTPESPKSQGRLVAGYETLTLDEVTNVESRHEICLIFFGHVEAICSENKL